MNEAIKITNLKKSYDKTIALKGIDISIKDGAFFGLLGPNGAGKTTTINILTGLVNKDSGETKVFNKDTEKDFRFTRSQIGISAQEFSQDWFFSLEKLLYFQAGYFGGWTGVLKRVVVVDVGWRMNISYYCSFC